MRTLLFTLEYPPFKGGVANVYGHMEKYWPKIASKDLGVEENTAAAHLRVLHNNDGVLLSSFIWPKWLPAARYLRRSVKRQKIEHIIVGHILPLGTVTYRLSKKTGIPYTVILHGMDLALAMKPGRKRLIAQKILQNAKNIICANAYTRNMLVNFMGDKIKDKLSVVHPGVEPEFEVDQKTYDTIKQKYNLANKMVLLSFGRLVKRKGFEDVIKAMAIVNKTYPDLHYFVSGDGPEKLKILDYSMQNKNITFLGHISDKEKNAWLKASDIFIMPSYSEGPDFEGFGIVYLEANIAGKPVIGGRSGGVPEAIDDGVSGLLVEPKNIKDIAKAIMRLAASASLREKMGRQGHDRAIEWFNWERQVKRIYQIINS